MKQIKQKVITLFIISGTIAILAMPSKQTIVAHAHNDTIMIR